MHSSDAAGCDALSALAIRLRGKRQDLRMTLLHPPDLRVATIPGVSAMAGAADTTAQMRELIETLAPRVVLLTGGVLCPTVTQLAADRGAAVMIIQARRPALARGRALWPGRLGRTVQRLHHVFVTDAGDAPQWRRLGGRDLGVTVTGPMAFSLGTLPCNEAEREALAAQLRLRPVWLAAGIPEAEEELTAKAHHQALRLSHRLLLLLHPADPVRGHALAARLAESFSIALRSRDDPVTTETQIYIVDTEDERGLWYRLATVSFMGGSLAGGGSSFDPMEPAALGSAVLHGARYGAYRTSFRRLEQQGATQRVTRDARLGEEVSTLLAPERAAILATAGWTVVSEGTDATDRVMDAVLDAVAQDSAA